jgi:hypothetical protein
LEKTVLDKVRLALQSFLEHHREMSGRVRKTDLLELFNIVDTRLREMAKTA